MKKLLTSVAAIAVTVGLTASAHAGAKVLAAARHGAWITQGVLLNNGENKSLLCGAMVNGSDKTFAIKSQVTNPLFFHLYKKSWRIPTGTIVDVNMQVDNAPAITFHMKARNSTDGGWTGTFLEYSFNDHVDPNTGEAWVKEFINLIATGNDVKFTFPQGDEDGWIGSLNGSALAMGELAQCMEAINNTASPAPATTQPFRGTQPTQPRQLPDTQRTQPYLEG